MTLITVGIGEMAMTSCSEHSLVTYALGPCLGVACYDAELSLAGLVHCQLPLSLDDPEQAKIQPARYVDSGITLLLHEMQEVGSKLSNLQICVAGGAQVKDNDCFFKIAQRNITVFRKLMWKNGLIVNAEDLGGDRPRTMCIEANSGRVLLKKDGARTLLFGGS